MLSVYFGTDGIASRSAGLRDIELRQLNGARIERVEIEAFSETFLAEIIGTVSLFGDAIVYVFDTPSDSVEVWDCIIAAATEIVAANNTVIVLERNLLAPVKKKLGSAGAELHEFTAETKAQAFDIFKIAEALSQKDKKNLWMLYVTAANQGVSAEELIGILWWQLKALRLALVTATATEAGMKDFPYNKAKKALRNFKNGEIDALSRSLLAVYHDGHGGVRDINLALEEWVLRV